MGAYVRAQEIEHDIGADGSFSLRLTSGEVELRAVEGPAARVRVEFSIRAASDDDADAAFEHASFRVRATPGALELREPPSEDGGIGSIARLLGVGNRPTAEASITAEIPAGASVSVHGVSAEVTAAGFVGAQQYRSVSGDLVLTAIAGDVRVRGVSSDVSLRADGPIALEANTVSGDLSVVTPRFDALRVVTVSGDVELEGALGSTSEHRIETVSGDLMLGAGTGDGLTLEVRGLSSDVDVSLPHRSEGSRDRRRYVVGDGAARLLFSSMSGDVSVHAPRRSPATPPAPPAPPAAPPPPTSLDDEAQLRVLRALERGEIDVDEAARRLTGGGA